MYLPNRLLLVVVGFGYVAAFQELFRPEFPALSRPDGTGDGKHHVTDAKVLFRAHDDLPFGGFQVQEVHEVAARQILELVVVAHLVNEQAQKFYRAMPSSNYYSI